MLGPLLYIICNADLGSLLAAGAVLSPSYADDLQAYVHCSADRAISAVEMISQPIETLQAWMSSNRLHRTSVLIRPIRSLSGSVPVSNSLRLTLGSLPLSIPAFHLLVLCP